MKKEDLRIIFYGSTDFSVSVLDSLLERNWIIDAVVTLPDKIVRRHGKDMIIPNPVKECADRNSIQVFQPENLKDPKFIQEIKDLQPNLQIVVAFKILPKSIWSIPVFGTLNFHPSKLPAYKGPAPVQWAIINGEEETCISAFFLSDKGIDSGKVIAQSDPISLIFTQTEVETAENILEDMKLDIIPQFTDYVLNLIIDKEGRPSKMPKKSFDQPESYAPKLTKENTKVDWNNYRDGIALHRFIQGLSSVPSAWTTMDGKEIKLITSGGVIEGPDEEIRFIPNGTLLKKKTGIYAVVGEDLVHLEKVQPSGKRIMYAAEFWNGLPKDKEKRLGT